MKILVTGANGQLGRELRRLSEGSRSSFVFTDLSEVPGLQTCLLDVTDPAAVRRMLLSERPGAVINCAGYTDVERAEEDPCGAARLNSDAPRILAEVSKECGCTLFHISTDFVFPGDVLRPLKETDPTGPLNVYGRTKLKGEAAVLGSGCRAIVVRTAWMYSPYGRNFVKTIMHLLSSGRESLRVVDDQTGSPTSAASLAAFLLHVIDSGQCGKTGLYHFAGSGAASRHALACAVRDCLGSSCRIEPCKSGEYPSKVRRPGWSALDCSLAERTFGWKTPDWRVSLSECIDRMGRDA